MRFDDEKAVDVESHPSPITEGGENHLQVNVVAEDHPKAKHDLKQNDDIHGVLPWQQEASDFSLNAKK